MAEAKKATKKEEAEAEVIAEAAPIKEKESGTDKKDSKNTNSTDSKEEVITAKAGKRSAKGVKEAEEKQEKIEHQKHAHDETADEEPVKKVKKPVKPTRSRLERRSKKYQEAAKNVEKGKPYSLKEAVEIALKTSTTKFDSTVELHVRLGVDPRQADQNIRGTVALPAGSGKNVRIAVFADVDDAKKAKAAGADIAGGDEFLQQLDKEQLDFDVLIATPQQMAKLGKYARILGPRGLMPNPKSGTVAADVVKAVNEAKAGKVEYRVDSTGIVHLGIGKTNFTAAQLLENLQAVLSAIKGAKPSSLKGNYVQSAYLTTTMGPSISILLSEM